VIKLYYYPSYISLVPHILLEELGTPNELIFVDRYAGAHKRAEYLALNPNGLIPLLVDGPLVVYEAGAICLHLSDTFPQAGLMPRPGSAERAHAYKWLLWLATGLQPALSNYLHPSKWGLSEAAQGELRTGAEAAVARHFDILDVFLAGQAGPWLTGADYSIVDAYALALCRWSRKMERPAASWPHVGPYARRGLERPAVQRALAQEHLAQPWI
jgi:glutathione S-transferase